MIRTGWPAAGIDAAGVDRCGMAELFGRYVEVARVAKIARVLVLVAAPQREGIDVVDHGGNPRTACLSTALA